MVVIKPFKGIRPDKKLVSQVASLPYDVLDSEEARKMAAGNPYSYLHIDKAEIDLPSDISPYDDAVYLQAKKNLQYFLDQGWLVKEDENVYYLYELTMNGKSQTGIVACTAIQEYLDGKIKKHELTRHEKELDRIRHVRTCDANTSPIFLAYRGKETINTIIHRWKKEHEPMYDFTSFYDTHHRLWLVDCSATIQQLENIFAKEVDSLYIADGHHRTESAVKVGLEKRKQFPLAPAEAQFNYFLSVIFPEEELTIYDYNRVLKVDIPENFLELLENNFVVEKVGTKPYKPEEKLNFGMFFDSTWYRLKATSVSEDAPIIETLDASILQKNVFETIFDITDIRTDHRIDFVGGIRGLKELETLVTSGEFNLAFSLHPTLMSELLEVADQGEIMPPKSTWFEPKLLSGLFLHDLETEKMTSKN
ncbi:DUF1015 domain-containing protein [Vagococcus elongatus]|uniref:DUF1015 domain-containing protein n=1 Tax=Vagococcus elongatus TaxID=180344 RepID=A0A430AU85_9ENTE|nr:DUF1015 family protein [Vagococcus elongatus]RSU11615.1 hypothetical protein CBF29_08025 [Vagococcus elongatus]